MTAKIVWRPRGENAQRMLIAGRSGMGKTTLARHLAGRSGPAVWVDPKGLNEAEWPVTVRADRFVDLAGSSARAGHLRTLLQEHTRIVVQLGDRPDYGDPQAGDKRQVDAVAEACYVSGNVLFACDDMQGVYDSRPSYFLHRAATMGRSRGVGSLCLVTSVIGFPLDFLRSANHIVAFAQHEEAEVDRLNKAVAGLGDQARALEPYEYVWADLDQRIVQVCAPLQIGSGVQAH